MWENNGYLTFDKDDAAQYEDFTGRVADMIHHLQAHHEMPGVKTDEDPAEVVTLWETAHAGVEIADDSPCGEVDPIDEDDAEWLTNMAAFVEACSDWEQQARYGETFINENVWVDYAQQTAEDTGMVDTDSTMSSYIDWDRWANDLRMDYTVVEVDSGEFQGTWYYRL